MNFRGRTVLLLVAIAIICSSLVTHIVLDSNPLEAVKPPVSDQTGNNGANEKKQDPKTKVNLDQKLSKVQEAFEIIRDSYVLEIDEEELLEGAIEGMLNKLEDPYSVYMDPEAARQFQSSLQSSFEGIGAEVMLQDGFVTIVAPIRGAPAEKAGLRPNDKIISVNGESLEGLEIHQAVMKIRGPKGTKAELEIIRPGIKEPMKITVVRDEIPLETVYSETIKSNGKVFGKIELTSFAEKTAQDFAAALKGFEEKGIDGLIIDVRGNPGGYLDAVREIGQLLVPNEGVITTITNREGQKVVYKSKLKGQKEYPITVLIDNGSASASEILAAALQEAGNYKLVGKTTFGKGTVQSTVHMKDDSEIKITIAKWLTPKENWIHKTGIKPDIEVEQPDYFRAVPIQVDATLERNANNEHVRNLQLILRGLGYDPGRNDGFYSIETETAVKSFQAKNNLQPTGKVDQKTASLMQEKLIEVIRDPKNDLQLEKAVQHLLKEAK